MEGKRRHGGRGGDEGKGTSSHELPPRRVRIEFDGPDFIADEDGSVGGKEDDGDDLRVAGELRRSWLLVPPSAKEVNDLAWLIADKFHLKQIWRQGRLLLELDGFALPLAESIDIVRDDDIIMVKKRKASVSGARKRRRESIDDSSPRKRKKKKKKEAKAVTLQKTAAKQQPRAASVNVDNGTEKPAVNGIEQEEKAQHIPPQGSTINITKGAEKKDQTTTEDADSSSSEDEESSSSSFEESSSSDEESSSSEEEEEEVVKPSTAPGGDKATIVTDSRKQDSVPQTNQIATASSSTPQTQASATPTAAPSPTSGKGHVRFGPDGEVQSKTPSAQPDSFRWATGRGRGRGLPHIDGPPQPPPISRGRGRGHSPPGLDPSANGNGNFGFGRGRGWGGSPGFPGRGRGQVWGAGPGFGPHGFAPSPYEAASPAPQQGVQARAADSRPTPPPSVQQIGHANDLTYAAAFAGQASQSSSPTRAYENRSGGSNYRHTPTYYSASLNWKKDTHPSYAPLPPLEPPKDYSQCRLFSDTGRNPKRGDVIAYKVLEINDGGPACSAFKEARVEEYDASTAVVTLRATALSSVPLDGRYVASEEDRAALFESTVSLSWDQLMDVRSVGA